MFKDYGTNPRRTQGSPAASHSERVQCRCDSGFRTRRSLKRRSRVQPRARARAPPITYTPVSPPTHPSLTHATVNGGRGRGERAGKLFLLGECPPPSPHQSFTPLPSFILSPPSGPPVFMDSRLLGFSPRPPVRQCGCRSSPAVAALLTSQVYQPVCAPKGTTLSYN